MASFWTLGSLDDIMPDIDNCHVLCFPCPDSQHDRAASILGAAYRCLRQQNPVLGGLILPSDDATRRPGTKQLQPAAQGECELEIKDARDVVGLSYDELKARGMPRRHLPASLVMPSRSLVGSGDVTVRRTTAVRATFVRDGCFLAFNTSHAFMDGMSVVNVMAALAAHAARLSQTLVGGSLELNAQCDLAAADTALLSFGPTPSDLATLNPAVDSTRYVCLKNNPRSWQMLGLDYRPKEASSAVLAARLPPMAPVTRLFQIDSTRLKDLKDRCSAEAAASKAASWVSTADSLTALLWSCIVRARTDGQEAVAGDDAPSTLMAAMDVRRLLRPPISDRYLGNAVLYSRSEASTGQLSSGLSLGAVAGLVRAGLGTHQAPEAIQETLELAASIPDVSALGLLYPTWLGNDVVISSIFGLPFYELDWGSTFGGQAQPDYFRFPDGIFDGICFVLPRRRDGSAEIQVTMHEPHMEKLLVDAEFRNYFTDVTVGENS